MKKLTALFLAIAMCMSLCVPAFAVDTTADDSENRTPISVTTETMQVETSDGQVYNVTLTERTYAAPSNGNSTRSFTPLYDVGTIKEYEVDISNDDLTSVVTAYMDVSSAAKRELANLVATAISAKIGNALIPGLNLAVTLIGAIGIINMLAGNEGFLVTVTMVYDEYYSNREGYYLYGWDFDGVDVETY